MKQAGAPKRMGRRADGAPRRRVTRLEEDSRPHRRKGQAAREVRGSKRGLCEGAGFAGAGAGVQLGEPEAGAVTGLGSEKPAVWGPWRLLGAWTQGSGGWRWEGPLAGDRIVQGGQPSEGVVGPIVPGEGLQLGGSGRRGVMFMGLQGGSTGDRGVQGQEVGGSLGGPRQGMGCIRGRLLSKREGWGAVGSGAPGSPGGTGTGSGSVGAPSLASPATPEGRASCPRHGPHPDCGRRRGGGCAGLGRRCESGSGCSRAARLVLRCERRQRGSSAASPAPSPPPSPRSPRTEAGTLGRWDAELPDTQRPAGRRKDARTERRGRTRRPRSRL